MRDPNACDALPDGIDGAIPGTVCPHNTYYHNSEVFDARDASLDATDRILRLVGTADAGLLLQSDLDILSITELLTAKAELKKIQNEKEAEAYERSRNTETNSRGFSSEFER